MADAPVFEFTSILPLGADDTPYRLVSTDFVRTVDTPLGLYNPDWAIVFEDTHRVYLVRETKGTLDADQRRHDENVKIECARRHFAAIDVDYAVATSVSGMLTALAAEGGA